MFVRGHDRQRRMDTIVVAFEEAKPIRFWIVLASSGMVALQHYVRISDKLHGRWNNFPLEEIGHNHIVQQDIQSIDSSTLVTPSSSRLRTIV